MTATLPMLEAVKSNWWIVLIRGILGVLFGILAFAMPGPTLTALVLVYGFYSLADGFMALWIGARARAWSLVLIGLLGIFVGIYTFVSPAITAVALLFVIALWAFVRGVSEIVTAIQLRRELSNEWLLIASGILSMVVAVALIANPAAGALAMVWVIGAYALIIGFMLIALAFRLRAVLQPA